MLIQNNFIHQTCLAGKAGSTEQQLALSPPLLVKGED